MGMVVQHNMNALNAYNKLNTNVAGLKKSSEKLSSGYRINRAGDDAAGLAISEKMRSQIRGLTQAKRNSQDGIPMIQTFEGATQESHSILQRMKELATESANGTYQNEVDRDAIQLEFNQLNDELDQIADTDFNGTVMLNGGQMADGTKQLNGKFDYENGTKAASKLSASDINILDNQGWDNNGKANAAWNKLNGAWNRTDDLTNNDGPDSVDITFKYNKADGTWKAVSASNGASVANVSTNKTKNGGFEVAISGATYAAGDKVADVVVDQAKLANGDTITLTFNNPATGISAPTNAGATATDKTNLTKGDVALEDIDLTVTIDGTNVTDAKMTKEYNGLFKQLDGATVEVTYGTDAGTGKADGKVDGMKLSLTDGTVLNIDTSAADGTSTITIGDKTFNVEAKQDTGVLTIKNADDKTLLTLTPTPAANNGKVSGSVTYKIGIENYKYEEGAKPSVEVAKTGNVSKSDSNNAATAPLTYTDHLILQTGARTKDSVDFTFEYSTDGMGGLKANMDVSSREGGLNTKNLSLLTQEDANTAIDKIDNAINKVSMVRATFGATQNRLEHKIENLTTTNENLTEAESGIRDTDMASEMLNYTKFNVLQQAAQSMLAQANQQPQSILQLLG